MVARSAVALPIAEQKIMTAASVRLDDCRPDHLGPLLGFVGNELAELGRGACERCSVQVGSAPAPAPVTRLKHFRLSKMR